MDILNKLMEAYMTDDKVYKINREDILELSSIKDTLKFYGNEDNYESPIWDEHGQYNGSLVDKDGGAKARVELMEV